MTDDDASLSGVPLDDVARQWLKETEVECEAVLARAQEQAARARHGARVTRLAAEAEAVRVMREASLAASRREEQAHEEAARIVADAHRRAGGLVHDARAEAARITEAAADEARTLVAGAHERVASVMAAAAPAVADPAPPSAAEPVADMPVTVPVDGADNGAGGEAADQGAKGPGAPVVTVVGWTAESWRPDDEAGEQGEGQPTEWRELVEVVREANKNEEAG